MLLPLLLNLDTAINAREEMLLHAVLAVLGADGSATLVSGVLSFARTQSPATFGATADARSQAYMLLLAYAELHASGREQVVLERARSGLRQAGAVNPTSESMVS